ncbi:MAG: isocitrate/isopropylmalate family dehydrogenase [Firmicutes bacterium]|nr:isocitrate/isopropylmalate family dehydrogenase [Bacillota bacterium]
MEYKISLLIGDGNGKQLIQAAADILSAIKLKYGHNFKFKYSDIGGEAIAKTGVALPQDTIDTCLDCNATLIGTIGNPKYNDVFGVDQSRLCIQKLYNNLKLYATIVPLKYLNILPHYSPLKDKILKQNIDITFVIETSSGVFSSDKGYKTNTTQGMQAFDSTTITTNQIQRISTLAFELAKKSDKTITLVDMADCALSSILWRQTIKKTSSLYPTVKYQSMSIDDFTSLLITKPQDLNIVLSNALLGKIILSQASALTTKHSLPKVVLGAYNYGVYGAYNYYTQKDYTNPIGIIMSVALMLKYSFNLNQESNNITQSLIRILKSNKSSILGKNMKIEKFTEQVCIKIINF